MKVDLHLHTSERSGCSQSSAEEQIRAAKELGFGGIAITDHDAMLDADEFERLRREHAPFVIFTGIEVSIGNEHIVILGVADPALESRDWTYPDLHGFVRERGGYLVLAHPFRYGETVEVDVETYPPDAIEVHSIHTCADNTDQIVDLARRLDCAMLCSSDSHHVQNTGLYHLELGRPVADDAELLATLRDGDFIHVSRPERIAEINANVEERESVIRRMIAEGKSKDDYVAETGNWEGTYNRVAMGRSYRI